MSLSEVSAWVKQLAELKKSAKKEIVKREYSVNALVCHPHDGGDAICLLDPTIKYAVGNSLSKHGKNYSVTSVIDAEVVRKQEQAIYIRSDQIAKAKGNLVYVAKMVDDKVTVGCLRRDGEGYSVLPAYQEKFGQATFKKEELITTDTIIVGNTDAAIELNELKRNMQIEPAITIDMIKESKVRQTTTPDAQPSLSRRM
jgi:hypothetical protein